MMMIFKHLFSCLQFWRKQSNSSNRDIDYRSHTFGQFNFRSASNKNHVIRDKKQHIERNDSQETKQVLSKDLSGELYLVDSG